MKSSVAEPDRPPALPSDHFPRTTARHPQSDPAYKSPALEIHYRCHDHSLNLPVISSVPLWKYQHTSVPPGFLQSLQCRSHYYRYSLPYPHFHLSGKSHFQSQWMWHELPLPLNSHSTLPWKYPDFWFPVRNRSGLRCFPRHQPDKGSEALSPLWIKCC